MKEYAGTVKKIVDTAIELFKREGYENVSVNEICKAADVSRSSFYNIFSGKNDIIVYMFSFLEWDMENIMSSFLTADNDFERMWMLCDSVLSIAENNGWELTSALYRVELEQHTGFFDFMKRIDEWCIKLYRNCLASGIAKSYTAPEKLVPLVAKAIFQIVYEWCCAKGGFSLKQAARAAAETLYNIEPQYRWGS